MKIIAYCLFFILISCQGENNESSNHPFDDTIPNLNDNTDTSFQNEFDFNEDSAALIDSTEYTKEVYFTDSLGWGYKILMDGQPYINQPHIPAVSGNKGFSTEENASITADYAIEKIKSGIMPPTLSIEELESLGVLD